MTTSSTTISAPAPLTHPCPGGWCTVDHQDDSGSSRWHVGDSTTFAFSDGPVPKGGTIWARQHDFDEYPLVEVALGEETGEIHLTAHEALELAGLLTGHASRLIGTDQLPAAPGQRRRVPPARDPLLIPLPEAALRIGVSPKYLADAVRTGEIEHVRVGRCARFTAEQIDGAIAQWTQPAATAQPQPLRARRRRTIRGDGA